MIVQMLIASLTVASAEADLAAKMPEIIAKSAAHYRALDAAVTHEMKNSKGEYRIPQGWNKWRTGRDEYDMRDIFWWTSGHYAGSLWYLFEATDDPFFRERACAWTEILAPVSKYEGNHDVGFMMYCSYGNARRILKTNRYDALLRETAATLSKRYSPGLGLIRSWGKIEDRDHFLVIPDNLMNLELMAWAGGRFSEIAASHADVTMKNHFRPDYGCYHVVDYDQNDGKVQGYRPGQGASTMTAWSRGQSWAIYGYTMMYRMTGFVRYLDFAQKLADYAIGHPNMPADGIPYWDYGRPGEERDSSAGSIMASALLELSQYADPANGARYRAFAVKQLLALASPAYFSEGGEVGHFLLKHGVGNKPGKSEIDTPLNYGDYYFLEALLRFRRLKVRGPFLVMTPAIAERAKRRIAENSDARRWFDGLRAACDREMSRVVELPASGGQWGHWYTCRKCATGLKTVSPTNHVCPNCGEIHSGWPYDQVVIGRCHEANAKTIRRLGVAYLLTDDHRYADKAGEWLLAYARRYRSYPLHNTVGDIGPENKGPKTGGRVLSQVLDECVWLISVVQGYDCVRAALPEAQRQTIEAELVRPAAEIAMSECAKIHNHECWHLAAFGAAGLVLGDEKMVSRAIEGPYSLSKQLERGLLADGTWFEGAWGYHFYAIRALVPFVQSLANIGMRPPERLREMFLAPFGQIAPSWKLPAVNDSGRMNFTPGTLAEFYEQAYAWWGDDVFGWWCGAVPRNSEEFVLYGCEKTPKADLEWASDPFPASGLAVLRARTGREMPHEPPANYVAIDYGKHGGWHGHYDKLNLILYGNGELLAEDPGCIGYGNPRHFGWYRTTLAHNSLTVDGRHQHEAEGSLIAFTNLSNGAAVAVDAGVIAPGARAGRATALCGNLVFDLVWGESDTEHDWEWSFHSRGRFSMPLKGNPFILPPPEQPMRNGRPVDSDGSDAWRWVRDLATVPQPGDWTATWETAKTTLHLFQRSGAGQLTTGEGCAQPASQSFRLVANRVKGKRATFATVLTLDGSSEVAIGQPIVAPGGKNCLTATVNGKTYCLTVDNVRHTIALTAEN